MRWSIGVAIDAFRERLRKLRGDVLPPAHHLPYRVHKLAGGGHLGEVSPSTCLECAHRILVLGVHAQHEHRQHRQFEPDLLQRFDAVLSRHCDVEHQHVAGGLPYVLHHFGVIRRLADDLEVGLRRKDLAQALADHRMIIGDQNADQCWLHAGGLSTGFGSGTSRKVMVVPPSPSLRISTSPPREWARSFMPRKPKHERLAMSAATIPLPLSWISSISASSVESSLMSTRVA